MENRQLMPEGENLQFQGAATPKPGGDQRGHCRQDREHGGHAEPNASDADGGADAVAPEVDEDEREQAHGADV